MFSSITLAGTQRRSTTAGNWCLLFSEIEVSCPGASFSKGYKSTSSHRLVFQICRRGQGLRIVQSSVLAHLWSVIKFSPRAEAPPCLYVLLMRGHWYVCFLLNLQVLACPSLSHTSPPRFSPLSQPHKISSPTKWFSCRFKNSRIFLSKDQGPISAVNSQRMKGGYDYLGGGWGSAYNQIGERKFNTLTKESQLLVVCNHWNGCGRCEEVGFSMSLCCPLSRAWFQDGVVCSVQWTVRFVCCASF